MADIPVYLVAGFLDAGKTNFINGILEDGFARQDPTLLLCCEEGEEEYEKNALDNVTVITIEDEEDLKCSYLKELEKGPCNSAAYRLKLERKHKIAAGHSGGLIPLCPYEEWS